MVHSRKGLKCKYWRNDEDARMAGYIPIGGDPKKRPGRKGMFKSYLGPNGEVQFVRVRKVCDVLEPKVRTSTRKVRKDAGTKRGPRKSKTPLTKSALVRKAIVAKIKQ